MESIVLYWTCAACLLAAVVLRSSRKPAPPLSYQDANQNDATRKERTTSAESVRLIQALKAELPEVVLLPQHDEFPAAANLYWAQQECEAVPSCVVRPRNAEELSSAVQVLKSEYDIRQRDQDFRAAGVFAIRSGGHGGPSGASSLRDGVVIDMSKVSDVRLSADKKTATIGSGARWGEVYEALAADGVCVVGGRNPHVGVGGLTLGGGLSFYSPHFGMVCNNIDSYEVVLASGKIVQASATENADLWRALKGGSNNFGIVTRLTARTFPAIRLWGGYMYMPYFEHKRVMAAFHETLKKGEEGGSGTIYDPNAGALLCCFTYYHPLRLKLLPTNLMYTGDVEQLGNKWPDALAQSPWSRLWRFWSTCSTRTLRSATEELDAMSPSGLRQGTATTTILNDPATLAATHAAWHEAISGIEARNVKGASWTLVLQPMLPLWARKGDPDPLGLDKGTSAPLVNVSFSVNWGRKQDDEYMQAAIRRAIEAIEVFAAEHDTGHPYKYLNYAASWQKIFEGYGEENHEFLKDVSRRHDPEGLFQRGCTGGFKLGM